MVKKLMLFSFANISERLRELADCFGEEFHNKAQLQMIEKATKELVDIILMLRNRYFIVADTDFKRRMYFDAKLSGFVNFKIDKNDYGYTLSLPFLLPKSHHSLKRSFWHNCLDQAIRQFENQYQEGIECISNPVVIFENQYVTDNVVKGLRDADNYELSDVLNFLQNRFYQDDRSVTLIIRNCGGFCENKTVVHVLNEKDLIEYLNNINIMLHPK